MEMPKLTLSSSPHIQTNENVTTVMRDVIIALLPATIAAIYYFRFGAIVNILVAVLGAVAAEYLIQKLMKKPITINRNAIAIRIKLIFLNAKFPIFI